MADLPKPSGPQLARQARERFVVQASAALPALAEAMHQHLAQLMEQMGNARELQSRRDALVAFAALRTAWAQAVAQAWQQTLLPPTTTTRAKLEAASLTLLGDEVVENKILSSRLALAIMNRVNWELNDLRLRIQRLEGSRELGAQDVLRPEVLSQQLVARWGEQGLSRQDWALTQVVLEPQLAEALVEVYHEANAFLVAQGVMPEIDLKPLVRRTGTQSAVSPVAVAPPPAPMPSAAEETRMLTNRQPLAKVRARAHGVLGQLKRMLGEQVADFDATRPAKPSPALSDALAQAETQQVAMPSRPASAYSEADVAHEASALQQRSGRLKGKAATPAEKATIEIVALMFQSILAEERLPPAIRVWFARLQMPVLRVALGEPEFFGTLQHPARQLIDHMGSCVMGFDATAIQGSALEAEIRRVVQVIEQYPETGRRVFQLMHGEFQKFLTGFLTEKDSTQRVVSVAQQVEQKETMAIQFTIELRNLLKDMPVRDEVRDFLFKVWAEVLAMSAVRDGAQHADTLARKRTAADLVWAASAKPNRNERARVIQEMPGLMQQLRLGMALLGLDAESQEAHLQRLSQALTDAFMSKTEAIDPHHIDQMTQQLARLEDFFSDVDLDDVPIDATSLEMMLGVEASGIEVVTQGGSPPNEAMLAWAQELAPGTWYLLEHQGQTGLVQLVWRSERRRLNLFVAGNGRSYLLPAQPLAAYLQAGLLAPAEEEALTVRATREAMDRLEQHPAQLLG